VQTFDFNSCSETSNNKIIQGKQNSKSIRLINPTQKRIHKITIDGCVVNDQKTKRCDLLFEIDDDEPQAIYVELKGKNITDAVEQLKSTLSMLSNKHKKHKKSCYVICSYVPKGAPLINTLKACFKKKFNADFFVRENIFEINV